MNSNKYFLHLLICLLFTLGLFIFEAEYLPFVADQAGTSGISGRYALAGLAFALTFLFVMAATSSPYSWRLIYLAIFVAGSVVEYGHYNALRHFSTAEDLENVIFGTNLDNKLDAAMLYVDWTALVPCTLFLLLLLAMRPLFEGGWKIFAAVLAGTIGFFTATGYFTTNNFPIPSSQALYRTVIGSAFKLNYLSFTPRRLIDYRAAERPPGNIVFIVDESISGGHLSINGYNRPTTPLLDDLNEKGFIANWGLAVSGTTCSITANKLLLTGVTDLPDTKRQLLNHPIIFQYAKAMGYRTHFFDGQMDNFWSLSDFDRQFVDELHTKESLRAANDFEIDAEIARRTREILDGSTGNFIWINKRGTHTPYQRAYPKSAEIWSPVYFADPYPTFSTEEEEKRAYINSHDNAVKYNLQLFFGELFSSGPNANTAYLYTSDHGQNLKEVANHGSHCGDLPQQTIVPLFLIADRGTMPEVDTDYEASHSNIFATLLDLMKFPEGERRFGYDISLLKATASDSRPRHFFAGNLSGDGGRRVAFDENLISRGR